MGGLRDRWVNGYMGRVDVLVLEFCGNFLVRLVGLSLWLVYVIDFLGYVLVIVFGKFFYFESICVWCVF